MIPSFSRSISLPLSPRHKNNKKASYHVRSVSLPCRSHPLISHLEEQIRAVRSWAANPDQGSMAWIESGLAKIQTLQIALEEFLHLSQTQETLSHAPSTQYFLDDFLLLADVYGSFISTIVNLKQHQSVVQSSIRRGDKISLATCLRSQKRVEKEISQLAYSLKRSTNNKYRSLGFGSNAVEAEIDGILMEAISATSAASMALFMGVMVISASSSKSYSAMNSFKKLGLTSSNFVKNEFVDIERLEELDMCIGNVENGSASVFRSVLNSRVLLLNISTPSL
ncbi:hypothetical protein LUZ60_007074 [Juncus effusus]|nr:hypothetical protein LUZ60_007074 [Juncus effusus]